MGEIGRDNRVYGNPYLVWVSTREGWVEIVDSKGFLPSIDEISLLQRELTELKRRGQNYIDKHNKELWKEIEESMSHDSFSDRNVETEKEGYIYLLECNGLYKIGVTKVNPEERLKAYETANPFKKTVLFCEYCSGYNKKEVEIKRFFSGKLRKGKEWFDFSEDDIMLIANFVDSDEVEIK